MLYWQEGLMMLADSHLYVTKKIHFVQWNKKAECQNPDFFNSEVFDSSSSSPPPLAR